MKELHVVRRMYADTFTMGEAFCGGPKWYSLELPWADNHPETSCIPIGRYKATRHTRADGLKSLLLEGVPGRTMVEVHPGNTTKQTHGCILLGQGAYCSLTAAGITSSDKALDVLYDELGDDDDIVVQVDNYGDLAHDQRPWVEPSDDIQATPPTTKPE